VEYGPDEIDPEIIYRSITIEPPESELRPGEIEVLSGEWYLALEGYPASALITGI
jgi:hypothetical protein